MTAGRYVEVCAGAGGWGLGLHRAGWRGTGIEWDADAAETHRRHVGPCITADVTTEPTPHGADLVCGGVPCQSFSLAGDRGGLDDPRGQLFRALLRHADEAGARVVALENVRGLISCGALPVILAAFRAHGYEPVHALLNACDYGVPQNRVRLFIVGFRDPADLARFRWPAPTHGAPGNLWGLAPWRTVREALGLAGGADGSRLDRPAPTIVVGHHEPIANGKVRAQFESELSRRLTVRDCARLQSFPDEVEFTGTLGAQFRQVGNAVAPLMGEAIARSVWAALYGGAA